MTHRALLSGRGQKSRVISETSLCTVSGDGVTLIVSVRSPKMVFFMFFHEIQ